MTKLDTHPSAAVTGAPAPYAGRVYVPIQGVGERVPEVARAYVATLRDLLRALGVSDVRMDQGSLRCDVNLSLRAKVAAGNSPPQGGPW